MELQHKQIEAIADNVQTVLNNELQSISKYKELENKFNNLQNAIFNPFNIFSWMTLPLAISASAAALSFFLDVAKSINFLFSLYMSW